MSPSVLLAYRAALVKGPATARFASKKYWASVDLWLASLLELVGTFNIEVALSVVLPRRIDIFFRSLLSWHWYAQVFTTRDGTILKALCLTVCLQDGRIPLNESVRHGNVEKTQSLIVAGMDVNVKDKNGATALDNVEANDRVTRDLLEHHNATLSIVNEDPGTLVSAALAHCAILSSSAGSVPASGLHLRPYQLDPFFLWAPPAARVRVFKWARNTLVAQLAATVRPFLDLSDDSAGDVLEYFDIAMPRDDSLLIATHCSSPKAIRQLLGVSRARSSSRGKLAPLTVNNRHLFEESLCPLWSRCFIHGPILFLVCVVK